jgi:hypothetical protein
MAEGQKCERSDSINGCMYPLGLPASQQSVFSQGVFESCGICNSHGLRSEPCQSFGRSDSLSAGSGDELKGRQTLFFT